MNANGRQLSQLKAINWTWASVVLLIRHLPFLSSPSPPLPFSDNLTSRKNYFCLPVRVCQSVITSSPFVSTRLSLIVCIQFDGSPGARSTNENYNSSHCRQTDWLAAAVQTPKALNWIKHSFSLQRKSTAVHLHSIRALGCTLYTDLWHCTWQC